MFHRIRGLSERRYDLIGDVSASVSGEGGGTGSGIRKVFSTTFSLGRDGRGMEVKMQMRIGEDEKYLHAQYCKLHQVGRRHKCVTWTGKSRKELTFFRGTEKGRTVRVLARVQASVRHRRKGLGGLPQKKERKKKKVKPQLKLTLKKNRREAI